ncbi:MDR family MFS transporter [Bowmanella pacifica]|uniref:MFS transporter n=1 Tax=Bowmanella pacifica TaxID=502051 RepID=A0A917YQF3_9ALTE|nr:MFS transporter [Bowmanella pacifica]GGO63456.1 MFS transporter [Bowmanella pacifica]
MNWQLARQFPSLVWVMILGVFFSRGTFFMVWPFMAIMLYQKFALNEWQIGLTMTISAVSAVLVGFYAGALTDRLGRKTMLLSAGVLAILAFSLLAVADEVLLYALCMALCAISREVWEPPAKALISDMLPSVEMRETAFQLRYFSINVGAALFPLAGVWMGFAGQQHTFFAVAAVYLVLLWAVWWAFRRPSSPKGKNASRIPFRQILRVLSQDKLFLLLVLANTLVAFVFAHLDSSLVQYLSREGLDNVVQLVGTLIFTNGMTIVCFQFVMVRLMQKRTLVHRVQVGMVLLTISQLAFALNPIDWYWGWIVATFFLSLGECILFPTMNIQIDRIAPANMRGVYYGAASLYSIGFAIAPYAGGLLLKAYGGPSLFFFTTLCCLAVFALYQQIGLATRTSEATEPLEQKG